MKRIMIIFTFLLLSFTGFCDTIDYWHVYINDKLIAALNDYSEAFNITLKISELKNSDTITVRYGNDTPCYDCIFSLIAFVEIKEKTPTAETNEQFGKLAISIKDLLDIEKKYNIQKFNFIYIEWTKKPLENEFSKRLFSLTFT